MSQEIIHQTGVACDGAPLIGGVWTLRQQEGFPLEMAHLVCCSHGWHIDWLEAMCDASQTNDLPALWQQVSAFLPADDLRRMKIGFAVFLARAGKTCAELVAEKRKNGAGLSMALLNDSDQPRPTEGTK